MNNSENHGFVSSSAYANPPFVWVPTPSPTTRGTYQILSLCASTTFICIWSAVHKDIPRSSTRLTRIRLYALQSLWVIWAFFFPEFLFVHALQELLSAKRLVKKFSKNHDAPSVRKIHWFLFWRKPVDKADASAQLAELGTLDVRHISLGVRKSEMYQLICPILKDTEGLIKHDAGAKEATRLPFMLTHAFYAMMGGYKFDVVAPAGEPSEDSGKINERIRATISPEGVQFLMEHDPNLTSDFLKSSITTKSDDFNKILLVFQLISFCVNCVSRLAEHLPLTLLEVTTAAHGLCTLATYAAWWRKPLNVEEPTIITCECAREAWAFLEMVDEGKLDALGQDSKPAFPVEREPDSQTKVAIALRAAKRYAMSNEELRNLKGGSKFLSYDPNDSTGMKDIVKKFFSAFTVLLPTSLLSFGLSFAPAVYGLFHFLGWNAQFPTLTERLLWRIATIGAGSFGVGLTVTVYPILILVCAPLISLAQELSKPKKSEPWEHNDDDDGSGRVIFVELLCCPCSFISMCFLPFIPILYLFSTLYLSVESIRQLFYLPPEAFVIVSWAPYLPHIS